MGGDSSRQPSAVGGQFLAPNLILEIRFRRCSLMIPANSTALFIQLGYELGHPRLCCLVLTSES
ncbi:hypothetical protein SBA1_480007 [Candidatus Sulfotelmatobacter kueseliae]|uniref:Uncharacterized protein n=1 Tax=Candidatus Sulfotelmatobacter kueseliae TaxID=2042962 RepID=A0A2U3KU94_9BACT|nr:hypothetical protein SBA1_480007 [Candidatus Sulfotelmatobacter kueseliae]